MTAVTVAQDVHCERHRAASVIVFDRQNNSVLSTMQTLSKQKMDSRFALKLIFLCAALALVLSNGHAQEKSDQKHPARLPNTESGKEIYLKYCASCHGAGATGNGPAAIALAPPPSNLTTLAKRNDGKFPEGYVGALVKFGRNLAAHGSGDMPVWGSRFRELDPIKDPTGQQHVDDVVAYLESVQVK